MKHVQMQWHMLLTAQIQAPPHLCYHAESGHSALKAVGINTGEPQNWEAL